MMKPNSCVDPKMVEGVFEGFLARVWRICSPHHVYDEVEFLINVFVENGLTRSSLMKIAEQ